MNVPAAEADDGAPRVLVIGRCGVDFLPVLAELRRRIRGQHLRTIESLDAMSAAAAEQVYDLVVILQEWPDQYTEPEILGLLDRFPLAQILVCYGAWCASDGRTRQRWPCGCRVPAAIAVPRILRTLAVIRGAAAPLPLTANRDDAFAFDSQAGQSPPGPSYRIAVQTPDPEIREWLTASLGSHGHIVVGNHSAAANLLIQDIDPWTAGTVAAIAAFINHTPARPVMALGGYVRPQQQRQLESVGVSAVLSKLTPLHELMDRVEAAARGHAPLRRRQQQTSTPSGPS